MSKSIKIILLAVALAAAALLAWLLQPKTEVPVPGKQPAASEPLEREAAEPTLFTFDQTVELGKEITLEMRFRDLSNLPADFSDYAEATKDAPALKGTASFKVLDMKETGRIGSGEALGSDETYWIATYEFQGDSGNPKGAAIRPAVFQAATPDMSPQLVLVDGDDVAVWSPDYSKATAKADGMFWPTYASLHSDVRRTIPAVWRMKDGIEPILALMYTGMDGKEHYIRVNY
jgi:hypothetical protein